ncbi:MAG: hypothetical protein CM1200mP29_12030 [Verrucomicrobiota bacterium]|nr:MAG: hypothetical protein CM1200mP29_12030 [Verrucomicrobiota bacterium]
MLGGGHLILAVDRHGDVTGTPWLANLVRARLGPGAKHRCRPGAASLGRRGKGDSIVGSPDNAFAAGQLAAAEVRLANGMVLFELDNRVVAAEANRLGPLGE